MTEQKQFTEINKIPALTWNWLKMNRATLSVEAERDVACERKEVTATKKGEVAYVHLDFEDGKTYAHEQVVVAEEDSELTVIVDYGSSPASGGFSTVRTRLVAKPRSKIHLVKVQLLGDGFVQIDETAGECADGASIQVTQVELGGSQVFAEVKADLNGVGSSFKSDTAYFCKKNQFFDFNYVVNHYGKQTDTKMNVKGVLADSGKKTYRGTIDFKNGCAGATGDEQEEILLVSPNVVNKSIPIILCGEESVSGTHGATIGRLGAEELFYFQSRGITEAEATKIMSYAKVMSVAQLVPDETLREKVRKYVGE